MFTTLIVRPILNLLVLIYAILPGHNFGLAIIIFTILVRVLMWPLVKKQLHQTKAMRALQPDIKRIKLAAKGNRQKESLLLMELYKEKGIKPLAATGLVLLQLPILIGLYSGLRRIVSNPHAIVDFSYPFLHNLPWLKELAGNIHKFDSTLFGIVDLTRAAVGKTSGIYWPAMLIVIGSAAMQYFQSKQLLPNDKESRGLKTILKDAGNGKQADQSEVNAAVGRMTKFLIPGMIFIVTVNYASALSLYWLVGGAAAFWQQARVLGADEQEMETAADAMTDKTVVEGEVIMPKNNGAPAKTKKKKSPTKKKRR